MAMRPLKSLISFEESKAILASHTRPIDRCEEVDITEARGRVLAREVLSPIDVPAFDRAAMDGYAVRAEDTFGAGKLATQKVRCVEAIYAGTVSKRSIGSGECAEIATGAPMPPGADGVVKVEETEREGDVVTIAGAIHPGENVSRRGEDVTKGKAVLREGTVLTPSKVGAIAALGQRRASVWARPRVRVVSSGDEIAEVGQPARPGQVYNINSYTLGAVIGEHGGIADLAPIVPDTRETLREELGRATGYDLVIFSAGSSVGERDMLIDVLEEEGEVFFHGIAVKPGKPTLFAKMRDGRLVLGMPGYPTSCLSNAYMLLVPMLRTMGHLPQLPQAAIELPLSKRIASTTGRHQFYTVRLVDGRAVPAFKESGAITSMSEADGYIEIPANTDLVDKGERVRVKLL